MSVFFQSIYRQKSRKKAKDKVPFLSPAIHTFLAQRLTDFVGGFFVLSGTLLFLALASYNINDPSLNTANSHSEISNILGQTGASISDILLQTLGLASYIVAAISMVWGVHILKRTNFSISWIKFSSLLLSIICASIALARIPAFDSWPLGTYLGGSGGTLLFNKITDPLQTLVGSNAHSLTAILFGLFSIIGISIALGINITSWKNFGVRILLFTLYVGEYIRFTYYRIRNWHSKYSSLEAPKAPTMPKAVKKECVEPITNKDKTTVEEPLRKSIVPKIIRPKEKAPQENRQQRKLDLTSYSEDWQIPSLELLEDPPFNPEDKIDELSLQRNAELLQATLTDFGVQGDILKVNPGPIVTLYELEPAPGTKSSRVINLSDDIARSMSATSVRVAVIPGKNALGIELPNIKRETVFLRELLSTQDYDRTSAKLPLVLGKDIGGNPVIADLTRMPHLLVAGTTGSGKSVAVNTMLLSLLFKLPPEKCRFIMIDPKMLELSVYDDIPHLLTPVVTEPRKAITSLKWAIMEMEDRYRAMSKLGVRNIDGFNAKVKEATEKGEVLTHKVQTGFDPDTGKPIFEEQPIAQNELPYIVIIVDEFADLMLVAGKEVENAIQRLAQMARAAGIHLIMATQRPSVDVITGVIKANFPTRISFQVTSKIDSRTILGDGGAEQLLGNGDMLYMAAGGKLKRVHGPFVDDVEVEQVVDFLKSQGEPHYVDGVTDGEDGGFADMGISGIAAENDGYDELYDHAVAIVAQEGKASTSFIQRHLQIGYNRAARIVEKMEKEGIIGPANHVGKREILIGEH